MLVVSTGRSQEELDTGLEQTLIHLQKPLIGGYEPANEGAASKSEAALSLAQSLSQSGGRLKFTSCGEWVLANHLDFSSQQGRTLLGAEAGHRRVAIIIVTLFST